jgi:hypothetical protein
VRVAVAEASRRGASNADTVVVPVSALTVDVAVGINVDAVVGAVMEVAGAAEVAFVGMASAGVAVGAVGVRVLVFVARTIGLGVRK